MTDWKEILSRARQAAHRIDVPVDEYLARRMSGEAWCSGCRDWHPEASFPIDPRTGQRRPACRVGNQRYEPRWKAARRVAARDHGHTGRCADQREGCYVRWGRYSHRHCACGEPMAVSARRCGRCEARELRWAA